MRKSLITTLLIVLVLTLIAWVVTVFLQPHLPDKVNNYLYYLILALIGAVTIVGFALQLREYRKVERGQDILGQNQKLLNRRNMLQKIWNTWIDDYLRKSLYNEVFIELCMETRPNAVEHPWDMVMQIPDREPRMVAFGTTMHELFDQASGALLILGEPGSGKTTMLLKLASQAIKRAQEDSLQPIPVVFNLSSWIPKQSFADWLVDELRAKYYVPQKVSRLWVENDELLLLIDGLDEVKAENREACVKAINSYREEHTVQLTICSRRQEYEALTAHLKLGGAVLIQPLTDQQVDTYLRSAGNGLVVVHQFVNCDPELREFAQTPLILNILILTYQNATVESLKNLETTTYFRKSLFDDYVDQMFKRRGNNPKFPKNQTVKLLVWLAASMKKHQQSLFYIEDIRPSWFPYSEKARRFSIGLILAILFGLLYGLIGGWNKGLPFGLIFGLIFGIITGRIGDLEPTEKLNLSLSGSIIGLAFGLFILLIGGLFVGLDDFIIKAGILVGLVSVLIIGLRSTVVENRRMVGEGIKKSLKNSLIAALIFGLPFALLAWNIRGLIMGLAFGLLYGGFFIIVHLLSRLFLYWSSHLPWNIVAFLDYCTDRIFLRRVGGGYIFIHRMLMEHFAEMDEERIKALAQEQ
ncbi:MAG: hypothetical protein A2W35_16395 [Chloroflexi bacterium RBG_16_57_11]|nr:MAG: hypothetical protein A2W35_16395 [Chloroflexi bacterium RBG_16_57_11]